MKIKKYIAENLEQGKRKVFEDLGDNAVLLSTRSYKEDNISKIEIVAAIDEEDQKVKNSQDNLTLESKPKLDRTVLEFLPDNIKSLYNIMIQKGFEHEFTLDFLKKIRNNPIESNLKKELLNSFSTENIFEKKLVRKIYSFSGITGSGSTSSLIKFAVISHLINENKILVVGYDNQIFGSKEVLKSYCDYFEFDFESAISDNQLNEVINENKSYDLILIDYPSLDISNYKDFKGELIYNIDLSRRADVNNYYLSSIEKKIKYIGLTKLDECSKFSEIFHQIINKPIVYYTKGIEIPDSMEYPKEKFLEDLLNWNGS